MRLNVDQVGSAGLESLVELAVAGDRAAYDQLFAIGYQDLHKLAHQVRAKLAGGGLNTTGLVHECYLRLLKTPIKAEGHAHFLAIMATAMRHLLIEQARAISSVKRGGGQPLDRITSADQAVLSNADELIQVDQLLRQLAQQSAQQVAIVECRYFAGLSDPETASALNLPLRTVQREWSRVRDWMIAQAAATTG